MTAGALLARLLAATPPPPEGEDLDHLIAIAVAMTRDREAVLGAALPIATPAEAAQLALLQARQQAWNDILMAARQRLEQQRLGATKVRAYAATLAAGCR